MVGLYLEAPFAVCRIFTAGWYRPNLEFSDTFRCLRTAPERSGNRNSFAQGR